MPFTNNLQFIWQNDGIDLVPIKIEGKSAQAKFRREKMMFERQQFSLDYRNIKEIIF